MYIQYVTYEMQKKKKERKFMSFQVNPTIAESFQIREKSQCLTLEFKVMPLRAQWTMQIDYSFDFQMKTCLNVPDVFIALTRDSYTRQ